MTESRAIWWVKRDMRVADNEALVSAINDHSKVIALFVCEPSLYDAPDTSPMHVFAWWQALSELQTALRNIGGELYFATGEVDTVLQHLYNLNGFDALYSHEETGNELTYKRDKRVRRWCEKSGVKWVEKSQNGVVRGPVARDDHDQIIRARLFDQTPLSPPSTMQPWTVQSDHLISTYWPEYTSISKRTIDPRIQFRHMQRVCEENAHAELAHFIEHRVDGYSRGISSPNSAFTTGSRLSPHLAWGTISVRDVFYQTNMAAQELSQSKSRSAYFRVKNIRAFQSRLHWRDHFTQRLESASYMEQRALNPAFEHIAYEDEPQLLHAWINGTTGIPLIDACMRCLLATGFLNFRMRAMLVTTACFGLRLSWHKLQYPLACVFYDYEPGIHFSQMQMQAGIVGINTMRVYNPHKQLLEQDPNCKFVKQWIPELSEFNSEDIFNYNHQRLGDYPVPIDDIAINAADIKDQISEIKKSEEAFEPTQQILKKHGSKRRSNRKPKLEKKQTPQLKLPI